MFTRNFFAGKRVTVMGLGLNEGGVGTVRFLSEMGVKEIVVTDLKSEEELRPSLEALKGIRGIRSVLGEHREVDFIETDLVIKNPGLPWDNPFIQIAEANQVPVTVDAGIFFDLCPVPIIGVTGTKGKTTTASLIAHLLEESGQSVVRAGISRISVLGELHKATKGSVVVFELSSWRLSALARIQKSPALSVVTNVYPDHQNYYGDMASYSEDKKNIFRFQSSGAVILNADNVWTQAMGAEAPARVIWFSPAGESTTEGFRLVRERIVERHADQEEEIARLSGTALLGEHHYANALAAVAAVRTFGIEPAVIQRGLFSFRGVPHRLELVGTRRGVRFFNDSAATIPEASIAALESFSEPVYLIVGGTDKALDFTQLAAVILERVKGVIFLKGTGTDKLLVALEDLLREKKRESKKMDRCGIHGQGGGIGLAQC
jgi:UDP-N-acetylmuramoylalanine--D-glutamate ligase